VTHVHAGLAISESHSPCKRTSFAGLRRQNDRSAIVDDVYEIHDEILK